MLVLGDILRRHAAVRGRKTAYVVGDDRVTYAAFHARSNQLARALARLGVRRGDRVAVLSPNRTEYPVIWFAVLKLGAIVVPVNARFTAGEVASVVGHAEAETLFVAPELAALAPAVGRTIGIGAPCAPGGIGVPCAPSGIGAPAAANGLSLDALADAEPPDDVDVAVDERDPHVMLYTSGTTGSPKGTLQSHRSYFLQAATSHLVLGFDEDDVALSTFPLFHMGGWAMPLGFWHTGGTVVVMPKADPRAILATIARERITYFYAVPTVYESLLAVPDFDRFELRSLRLLGGGTAPMSAAQVDRIRTRFGCPKMVILYGSTEAGPVSVVRPPDVARKSETVGRPYLDVDVRLVDADGRPVPPGGTGEVAVRSEFTMQAYWRNPEETANTLRDGWVMTGDLGRFDDDGFLAIVGRVKDVIRSGGENVFPVEIERVLALHEAVREAAVVGVPDARWGEAAVAALVLRDGAALGVDDVLEHIRRHLAGYKKPRDVCFFTELPRTAASQQVDKRRLRELVLERLARPEEPCGSRT